MPRSAPTQALGKMTSPNKSIQLTPDRKQKVSNEQTTADRPALFGDLVYRLPILEMRTVISPLLST